MARWPSFRRPPKFTIQGRSKERDADGKYTFQVHIKSDTLDCWHPIKGLDRDDVLKEAAKFAEVFRKPGQRRPD